MKQKSHFKNYLRKRMLLSGVLPFFAAANLAAQAPIQDFPFENINGDASTFSATININTSQGTSAFNNLLLGSNVDINTGQTGRQSRDANGLGVQGFNSPTLQDHLNRRENDPVVIRFPQGVFANLYNWKEFNVGGVRIAADSRIYRDRIPENDPQDRVASRYGEEPGSTRRLGYPALRGVFDRAESRGLPLDLLTVLNIIEDNEFSSRDRIQSMRDDGFTVRDVELGNEFFFRTQRSNTIDTEEKWLARAQEVVRVLRRNNNTGTRMRFAIPISFRAQDENDRNAQHTRYNREIIGDQSFFDAIVVHRYVRVRQLSNQNPTAAANLTDAELAELMTASPEMANSINFCKGRVRSDKRRVWLTEWGVAGGTEGGIGASYLGMADTYLDLLKRNDMDRINWFSTFGQNEQFIFPNNGNVSAPTGFGSVYQIFRDALRDQQMFNSVVVTSPELQLNGQGQNVKAVNAIGARVNGAMKLLVVNLANKRARVVLRTNTNRRRNFSYSNTGVRFGSLRGDDNVINVSESESEVDVIELKPYSVTVVDLDFNNSGKNIADEEKLKAGSTVFTAFPNPSDDGVFTLNKTGNWEAYTLQGAKIKAGRGENVDLSGVASGLYLLKVEGQILKLSVN